MKCPCDIYAELFIYWIIHEPWMSIRIGLSKRMDFVGMDITMDIAWILQLGELGFRRPEKFCRISFD